MLNQKLQQRLLQKLSPQQVLVMRLVQEPILSLEQRIKQELEENPALEEAMGDADDIEILSGDEDSGISDEEGTEEELTAEPELTSEENAGFDLEDYLDDEEIPDYRLITDSKRPDGESREIPVISTISFQDYLLAQLGMNKISDKDFIIAANIIGNLDDAGYLRRDLGALADDLSFNQNIDATPHEIESSLTMVQSFDPPGIAARNLQECLLIQLDRAPIKTPAILMASEIIRNHFNEFSKKHYDKIKSRLRIGDDTLKEAFDEIQKLNPKPGGSIGDMARDQQYIIPDFIITNTDGELELTLNSRNAPELILNRQYIDMLRDFSKSKRTITLSEKSAMSFIKKKIDAARGFIDAIRQRQETLLTTMAAIMDYQKEYFLSGDDARLKPMILKDIANIVKLDISTISRVANSKYVQTPFGTFLLKSFFSDSVQNTKGEEVSTREVKKFLKDIVEGEDKSNPYTDDQLVDMLKEKGYNIARRTIAKYRKNLRIPVARLRIEI
jgi:RNA polymerase sigma-54 factor